MEWAGCRRCATVSWAFLSRLIGRTRDAPAFCTIRSMTDRPLDGLLPFRDSQCGCDRNSVSGLLEVRPGGPAAHWEDGIPGPQVRRSCYSVGLQSRWNRPFLRAPIKQFGCGGAGGRTSRFRTLLPTWNRSLGRAHPTGCSNAKRFGSSPKRSSWELETPIKIRNRSWKSLERYYNGPHQGRHLVTCWAAQQVPNSVSLSSSRLWSVQERSRGPVCRYRHPVF